MTTPSQGQTQNEMDPNSDLAQRNRIHYEWMLSRIQGFKSLVLAIVVAMMGYVASTIDSVDSFCALGLLCLSALLLLTGFVLAGLDAGGAAFYNEESQNGLSKRYRCVMYMVILIAALLIFVAKICTATERIQSRSASAVAQQIGPANGSQPIRSETNRPSPAAGSRR